MTTSPEIHRNELARTLMDASAYAGQKCGSLLWPNMADMVLAAGYRKPRTITTVEELDALPDEAVVRSDFGVIHEKRVEFDTDRVFWVCPGGTDEHTAGKITLPATVLWEPEA